MKRFDFLLFFCRKGFLCHLKLLLFIIFIFISLSSCGFHLRQTQLTLSAKYPTLILPPSGSNTLHQALYNALQEADIHVKEESFNAGPQLIVISQVLTQSPLVYGPDAELRRERMKMAITFSFGCETMQQFELSTERDRQLNSNQHLGDNAEKIIIEREMQSDIINQLLRFLASHPI